MYAHTFTNMQEKGNKTDALHKNNIKFDNQRWLTLAFEQLVKTGCYDFPEDVKRQQSEWIKDSGTFNSDQLCVDMLNLYTNYKSTGEWEKNDVSCQQSIIDLAMVLANKRAKNK